MGVVGWLYSNASVALAAFVLGFAASRLLRVVWEKARRRPIGFRDLPNFAGRVDDDASSARANDDAQSTQSPDSMPARRDYGHRDYDSQYDHHHGGPSDWGSAYHHTPRRPDPDERYRRSREQLWPRGFSASPPPSHAPSLPTAASVKPPPKPAASDGQRFSVTPPPDFTDLAGDAADWVENVEPRLRKSRPLGKFYFGAPSGVIAYVPTKVEIQVLGRAPDGDVHEKIIEKLSLLGAPPVQGEIATTESMVVELHHDDSVLKSKLLSPRKQPVRVGRPTVWQWELTGLKRGTHELSAKFYCTCRDGEYETHPEVRSVQVKVNVKRTGWTLTKWIGAGIAAILISPLVAGVYAEVRKPVEVWVAQRVWGQSSPTPAAATPSPAPTSPVPPKAPPVTPATP